jgi:hypothetical protein
MRSGSFFGTVPVQKKLRKMNSNGNIMENKSKRKEMKRGKEVWTKIDEFNILRELS